jgi:hypothetical protein
VPLLSRLAEDIIRFCLEHSIRLRALHLPGVLNLRADIRSRWKETAAERRLNPETLQLARAQLGFPEFTVDLFASRHNRQCPRYFSLRHEPESSGLDAMSMNWAEEDWPYAYPAPAMLPQVVAKIRREGLTVCLVTPAWGASWLPLVLSMAVQPPVILPQAEDLFLGLDGLPRRPPRWATWVWFLQGSPLPLPLADSLPQELRHS